MVVIDVDDVPRLIGVRERHGPIRADGLFVVNGALVMAMVHPGRSHQREEPALVQPIGDVLNNTSRPILAELQ